ncbi:hypothetical protein LSM04_005847 [Trypanosoma melophagium]|uniref:uncharacterized protein n=1 Tax=Trypanosoma melophagium TaxID=715481 RepID=UPI00351A82F5|nr:hypothetical protein LSM04_005847 [Trypanosoma melophagium]
MRFSQISILKRFFFLYIGVHHCAAPGLYSRRCRRSYNAAKDFPHTDKRGANHSYFFEALPSVPLAAGHTVLEQRDRFVWQ